MSGMRFAVVLSALAMAFGSMVGGVEVERTATVQKSWSLTALTFGDLYSIPRNHLPEADGDSGGWIRRIYVTFEKTFTETLAMRFRLEGNHSGVFTSPDFDDFDVDFKDVYLRWSIGRQQLFFGLTPAPTFDLFDKTWGYRHLERSPQDVQGLPSRDNGILAHGPLTRSGQWRYRAMIGSGAERGKETGEGQKLMGAFTWENERGWLVDLYADTQRLPGPTDRTTFQLFGAYRRTNSRFGLQYTYQDREEDPRLEVGSAYGIFDLSPRFSLVGRIDHLFAPSPKGNDIPYLPFSPDARANLLIAAVEWRPNRYVSLLPNVESIFYGDSSGGQQPENDLLLRLTFYFHIPGS
jgi:hypothetical protein